MKRLPTRGKKREVNESISSKPRCVIVPNFTSLCFEAKNDQFQFFVDICSCSRKTSRRSGFVNYHNIVLGTEYYDQIGFDSLTYYTFLLGHSGILVNTISGPAFRFKQVAYEPSTQIGTLGSYLWMLQFKETKIESHTQMHCQLYHVCFLFTINEAPMSTQMFNCVGQMCDGLLIS